MSDFKAKCTNRFRPGLRPPTPLGELTALRVIQELNPDFRIHPVLGPDICESLPKCYKSSTQLNSNLLKIAAHRQAADRQTDRTNDYIAPPRWSNNGVLGVCIFSAWCSLTLNPNHSVSENTELSRKINAHHHHHSSLL